MAEQNSERLSNEDNLRNLVEEHFGYRIEKNVPSYLVDIGRGKNARRIRDIAEISGIGTTVRVEEIFRKVFYDVFMMSTSRNDARKKLGELYEKTEGKRGRLASITLNTLWEIREKRVDQALNQD